MTTGFDRSSAPLVQLTHAQIGQTLARQNAWAANRSVTAWLLDGRVHVSNTGTTAVEVPLTGATAGELYGGQRSGWITLAPGAEQVLAPNDPAATAVPAVTGTERVGETLSATTGTWTGTAPITYTYRWQRCRADGTACATLAGERGSHYTLVAADEGSTLRVIVLAGNFVSSVSQAASPATEHGACGTEGRDAAERAGRDARDPRHGPRPGARLRRPRPAAERRRSCSS